MSTKSRWFYVCFGLTLVGFIATDCPFPKQNQENLQFHYQSREDARRTIAPENYLLKFRCSPGYTRIGPRVIVCIDNKWTSDLPSCERMQCPDPPSIENGEYELRSVVNNIPIIGSSAFYICKLGYEYENDTESSLICAFDHEQDSANWSGEIPTCKEKSICPDPEVSKDGDRKGSCCYSGDVLQFSCNSNYELVGSKAIECLSTGSWNSTRPLCKPTGIHCEIPPLINHGLITGHKDGDYFRPYDELEIVCEPGYSYKGPNQFVMCEEEGVWEEEFGECLEIFCDPPGPLENGTIPEVMATNLTSFPYNFEITYVCNKGFRLVRGDGWSFCGKGGWFGKIPYCEEIHCPDPDSPEHGLREVHSLKVGAKVNFSCFSKYYLLGSFERYCMPNGQWSGELARCDTETNYCPDPGVPINGFKSTTNYDEGVWVRFRCRSGYILVGSELRNCLHNRTWSGEEPKCLGPYDYDNNAHVRDILKAAITKKAEEQEKEIQKYREAILAVWNNGPVGRILDLRYPGRYVLYFVFDTSGSIGRANFDKSIEFAKAIVKRVTIKKNGARAAAVTFSSTAVIQFLPFDYENTQDTLDAFDTIEYTGGGTSINSGLQLLRMDILMLVKARFGAKGIRNVVFLLTDGKANMGGNPQEEAAVLKGAGVEIYSIGITGNILKETLYKISSEPTDEHVFILENYSTLAWLVQEITNGTIDYSECGLGVENAHSPHSRRPRIVGGELLSQPWPWMAAVYFLPLGSVNTAEATFQCGGTIIHERFILTVAHCMYSTDKTQNPVLRNVEEIMVKLGLTNLKDESYVQEPEVLTYFIHPKYRPGTFYDYDIALLYLRTPIEFNAYVRPVCLPPAELPEDTTFYKANEFGLATGWGHERIVSPNMPWEMKLTDKLKQVLLPIQSIDRCKQSLVDHRVNLSIFTDRMFCAGSTDGGSDTCYGDTGGPLMQSHLNSEGYLYWTQVGIISWGIGCGLANTYGYYTHVQQLRLWIDNTIEDAIKESFLL